MIFLGLYNPHSDDPREALSPRPKGASGWRLWKVLNDASGMTEREYESKFRRYNLLTGSPRGEPSAAAQAFLKLVPPGSRVVALGDRVRSAVGIDKRTFEWQERGEHRFAFPPHPSGLNRFYNDPASRRRAAEFLLS